MKIKYQDDRIWFSKCFLLGDEIYLIPLSKPTFFKEQRFIQEHQCVLHAQLNKSEDADYPYYIDSECLVDFFREYYQWVEETEYSYIFLDGKYYPQSDVPNSDDDLIIGLFLEVFEKHLLLYQGPVFTEEINRRSDEDQC